MRVLLAHNRYTQPSGEDVAFAAEAALLRRHGHEVIEFTRDNAAVEDLGRLALLAHTVWSRQSYRELREVVADNRVEVAHFHNTLPLISPAGLVAAKAAGAATVQTLHNYRLLCPSAVLFRQGRPCHDCLGRRFALPGVRHACYRGSRGATAAVATMTAVHRLLKTWDRKVDRYIALTESGRRRFIEGGLPAAKLAVKGNFLADDPGAGAGGGGFALFAGRLAPEKGLDTLLRAWRVIGRRLPLQILGDGPLAERVRTEARTTEGVEWLGSRPRDEVLRKMGEAALVVVPSEWEEPFGLVVIEAFAKGTPVVAAAIGALPSLVDEGRSGFLFPAGDAEALTARVEEFLGLGETGDRLRAAARAAFAERHTAEVNYRRLMAVYEAARAQAGAR
ncbi:MAG: glycosyltransferase family 4 protein [Thermoanaerobaculia bacterium]|nr:glycosyltransferase family 4 protein [Thermoanaerobaculia bacterium]